jgi:hypothetical protein
LRGRAGVDVLPVRIGVRKKRSLLWSSTLLRFEGGGAKFLKVLHCSNPELIILGVCAHRGARKIWAGDFVICCTPCGGLGGFSFNFALFYHAFHLVHICLSLLCVSPALVAEKTVFCPSFM